MEGSPGVINAEGGDLSGPYDEVSWNLGVNGSEELGMPENGTNTTVVLHELGYSTLHIIISSILLTFMMIVVVIGNMLVIIAIATEKSLKNLQNWFIASLAVADFFVGLLIMPFSLANELMGYWIFGSVWCSIHSAMDVLLCTSSIMNICLISLDRYWSITQAVDYLKKRTPARAAVMIGMVWVLSALISIPPLLGWRDPDALTNSLVPTCQLSREIGYVLYSALGSFYIPSCIMVFVYIRIYFAARARARRAVRKPPKPKPQPVSIEIEERHPAVVAQSNPVPNTPTVNVVASSALIPPSSPAVGSPPDPQDKSPSLPTTPDSRSVKQVGFQEPLETRESVVVKPEITVERCAPPESSTNDDDGAAAPLDDEAQLKLMNDGSSKNNRTLLSEIKSSSEGRRLTTSLDSSGGGSELKVGGGGASASDAKSAALGTSNGSPKSSDKSGVDKDGNTIEGANVQIHDDDRDEDDEECGGSQPLVPTVHLKQESSGLCGSSSSYPHHPLGGHSSSSPQSSSTLAVRDLESAISEIQSNGASRKEEEGAPPTSLSHPGSKRSKRTKLHFLRVETPTIWRTSSSLSLNGDVHILGTLSRSCSRLQLDMDPVSDVEPSSSDSGAVSRCAVVKPLKLRLCQPFFGKKSASSSNKARRDVLDMGKLPSPKDVRDPEREKRRIARKKEKRATLILGLIMGSFILCWLPFFFLYILEPLCPSCQVAPWGFAIAFWLGYMNSALNPVIYTIFNKDFRRAFRRILFK